MLLNRSREGMFSSLANADLDERLPPRLSWYTLTVINLK
jgi:hypothetical protein